MTNEKEKLNEQQKQLIDTIDELTIFVEKHVAKPEYRPIVFELLLKSNYNV